MPSRPITARVKRSYHMTDARAQQLGLHGVSDSARATDAFTNAAARMGWGTPSLAEGADYQLQRFSYNYILLLTLYREHWISRRIVDGVAGDMVRAWPKTTSEIEPKDLTRLDRALRVTRVKSQILKTLKWARLFGGAGALLIIDGQQDQLEEPLDYETVAPGAFKGLAPFDRWTGVSPEGEVCHDINRPLEFDLPEYYRVSVKGGASFRVHSTRILRFLGPEVPTPEYEAQAWWGISVLEPAYEEIRKRDNMSWNILSLTFRASLLGFKWGDMAQALSGAGMNTQALVQFEQRMEAFNRLLSNQSVAILPADGGLESVNYTFSGLSDVYQQFQLDIAGAAGYPVSRLFGRTITGLGQSNDADERLYEERVAMEQEEVKPQLEKLYSVLCMSELGEIPEDLDLVFPSIRVLNDTEKATIASQNAATIVSLVNAGILSKPQAMKEVKQGSDVTGIGTNISDEDIDAAQRDEDLDLGPLMEGETGAAEPATEATVSE